MDSRRRKIRAPLVGAVVLAALSGQLAGCESGLGLTDSAPERASPASRRELLAPSAALEVGGCRRQWRDGRCEVRPGDELVLWRAPRFRSPQWSLDGQLLSVGEAAVVAGGYQVRVSVPPAPGRLTLEERGRVTWSLQLAHPRAPPSLQQTLRAAETAKNRGDHEQARRLLEPLAAATGPEQQRAQGLVARLLLREGQVERASEMLEATTGLLSSSGDWSEAAKDVGARTYLLAARLGQPAEAERWLQKNTRVLQGTSPGATLLLELRGMLAYSQERLGEALHWYDRAGTRNLRLGEQEGARRARAVGIGILGDIGRVEQALSLHRSTPPPDGSDACETARFHMLGAWLAMRSPGSPTRSALELGLNRASHWEERCGDPALISKGRTNRALWALSLGDIEQAVEAAQALSEHPPRSADAHQWALEARGRVALSQGDFAGARSHFERERLLGEASGQLEAPLRADVGLAETALAQGDETRAAAHFAIAFERLKNAQQLAPLGPLGQSFSDSRWGAATRLLSLAWQRGARREAYNLALSMFRLGATAWASLGSQRPPELSAALARYREARRALDAASANDWRLSTQELALTQQRRAEQLGELRRLLSSSLQRAPAPLEAGEPAPLAPGEAELLAVPHEGQWLLFGRSAKNLEATLVDNFAEAAGADPSSALAALKATLWRATRVTVRAAGAAQQWPWEALQWNGEPLAHKQLAFSSGLGPSRRRGSTGEPVVIGDPREDLPHAAREVALIREALGVESARVATGPAATPSRFLELAEKTRFMHYAGHAATTDTGTELLLAGDSALAGWELFGLQRVPAEVVLSACTAGSSVVAQHGTGWGLSHLFLALGSEAVVAPVGFVGDRESLIFQGALYQGLAKNLPLTEAFWQVTARLTEARKLSRPEGPWQLPEGSSAANSPGGTPQVPFRLFVR